VCKLRVTSDVEKDDDYYGIKYEALLAGGNVNYSRKPCLQFIPDYHWGHWDFSQRPKKW
jgi:hypothetical protein